MPPNATVYIVDDDQVLCDAMRWLLESVGLTVDVSPCADAFLAKYTVEARGCIILDVRMPGVSGLQLQAQLNARYNRMPIILLTGHADIPLVVDAMKAGAMDFMTKPFNAQHLLERVQKALAIDKQRPAMADSDFVNRLLLLTQREKQVLELIVAGKLNKQIAAELTISIKTVELHRSNLMQKLKVVSLAELIKLFLIHTPVTAANQS